MQPRWAWTLSVLSAVAFALGAATPRLALCLGADGHRAVELSGAECCATVSSPSRAGIGTCSDDCLDVPMRLWAESTVTARGAARSTIAQASLVSPASAVSLAEIVAPSARSVFLERGDRRLLPIRSLVLRC